jgi:SAM-dependent methyltransferase
VTSDTGSHDYRVIEYYTGLLQQHGPGPRAVDWGTGESQALRFNVLCAVGPLENTSVLDVGCGLGDLYGYLRSTGVNVQYTGYDITPALLEAARARFPKGRFIERNVVDLPEAELAPRWDYVIASGIFYLRQRDPDAYLRDMVARLSRLARRGVAFNTLSARAPEKSPDEYYADPAMVVGACLDLTPRVVLRHDYMPHDFTVYLYPPAA